MSYLSHYIILDHYNAHNLFRLHHGLCTFIFHVHCFEDFLDPAESFFNNRTLIGAVYNEIII